MGRPGRNTTKRGLTINDPAKEAAEAGLVYATDAELGTVAAVQLRALPEPHSSSLPKVPAAQ